MRTAPDRIAELFETLVEAREGEQIARRQAGPDRHQPDIGFFADLEPLTIEEGALPLDGREHLVGDRIVERTADGGVAAAQRDRDRVVLAVDEIGGAVDRIDQPAMLAIAAIDRREFFSRKAPVRVFADQHPADQLLRLLVGIRDEVRRTLDADLEIAEALEMFERQRAGLAGDRDHVGEDGFIIVGHQWLSSRVARPSGSSVVIWSTLKSSSFSTAGRASLSAAWIV